MSYLPIRLRTIKPNIPVTFNVYIQLRERYVLYIRSGDDIEAERLSNLKSKKVRKLFISAEDEQKYQNFLDDRLTQAMNDENLDSGSRAQAASEVASAAVEDMHEDPESVQTFKLLEKAAEGIINIVGKKSDVLAQFFQKVHSSDAPPVIKHALNVSSLVACVAEELGLPNQTTQNMAVASLLMDVGMIRMPPEDQELFVKERKSLTSHEWKRFREHPSLSRDILNGKDYVNNEILNFVYTHEELASGEGFPQGIQKLSLEQEVIGISSCFDRQVSFLGKSYSEALEEISVNQLGNFDLKLIKKFKTVINKQSLKSSTPL